MERLHLATSNASDSDDAEPEPGQAVTDRETANIAGPFTAGMGNSNKHNLG